MEKKNVMCEKVVCLDDKQGFVVFFVFFILVFWVVSKVESRNSDMMIEISY